MMMASSQANVMKVSQIPDIRQRSCHVVGAYSKEVGHVVRPLGCLALAYPHSVWIVPQQCTQRRQQWPLLVIVVDGIPLD
jgi:hypothetical protein